ncbi:MAG: beta-ketoacyl-[acyl-carrier-protein] synthase family protein [Chthoniobacteraceae bacterium]
MRVLHNFADGAARRVVVTGMGVVSPSGCDLGTFWKNVRDGRSAVGPITRFDASGSPSRLAAEIRDWNPTEYLDVKSARRFERSLQYGIVAAKLAVADSRLDFDQIDADRAGVVEATSLSNMEAAYSARDALDARGSRAVSPSMMISGYVGSGSAEIANAVGCRGHALTCSSSSASGNDVMGYARYMIQHDDIDVMIAGGAEAPIVDTVYFGFAQSRAMTRWSGPPEEAMKPFDQAGDGFVMGEGSAYLVLEELTHALSRGARIYAELLGQARACEAYHPMAPHPDGWGVSRAMTKAMQGASIDTSRVSYINVHGTANSSNDIAETRAIKEVFGSHARRLAVSSTKPVTGHPLAAAGAIEAVVCALAISQSTIPPTINHRQPHLECDLDYVPGHARPYPIEVALSLNSGFGGKTSCLILGRHRE